jgi:hypothetical protein
MGHGKVLPPGLACQADLFQRSHQAMDSINTRYGAMTLTSARLLDRSSMPGVIARVEARGAPQKVPDSVLFHETIKRIQLNLVDNTVKILSRE